ncbi:lamin tail domain-containing protein [Niallia sp. Krafla_26]|uniref:lamin tail domain-containing protein n=1 Tax=Niallia sp. Krafla_26 TaxID=3064703 RepID=UPI003D16A00E
MKKNKGLKKGMAMTATIALLVSNMSIAVPTIKAEEVSHIPLSQENANETEQVIVEPNSDAVKLESNLEDSTIISEEIKNENKTENEMNDDLDPSITEPDRQSENNTKESTSKTVIDSTNGQIQEKSTVEQMNSLEQLEERTTSEEQEETIDYQSLPSLLITEIMPNNTGADDYEYFEVYNNTNQPIVLDHYTFSLRYTDGSGKADVDMQFAPTTLAPKESIVFWHNSNQKTLDDFNSHYQTTLSQNQVVEFSGTPNFYNSGNRAVVIKDMAGKI